MFRNPHTLPLLSLISAFAVAIGAALFMSVGAAHAEIDGPCTATIAGVDVATVDSGNRNDDIKVSQDQSVTVSATSPIGFEYHKIQLEFAGQRWTVSEDFDDGAPSWSGEVDVDDYATWGVGLYKVIGVSTLTDGSTCEGAATVDVDGNPLATVAGAAAAAVTAVGVVGAVGSGVGAATRLPGPLGGYDEVDTGFERPPYPDEEVSRGRPGRDPARGPITDARAEQAAQGEASPEATARAREAAAFEEITRIPRRMTGGMFWGCLWTLPLVLVMTPLMAMTGGGSGNASSEEKPKGAQTSRSSPKRVPRPPWVPRITLLGLVGGFLAGAGSVVLMQQYAIEYPTLAVVLRTVIVMTLIGGVLLPTIGYTIGWLRVNRRIAQLEKDLQ